MQGVERDNEEAFRAESYDFDQGRVVVLCGELDVSTCPALSEHLAAPPRPFLVLDLSGLTFIDSSGLGAIHSARQRSIHDGGTLVVARPTPIVRRVFEITGLDSWITEWDVSWSKDPDSSMECTA